MNAEAAQTIGLEALAFLASDEHRLGAFLAQAGWTLSDLREGASDPAVIGGVLDFLLSDERLVLAFCEASGHTQEAPMRARRALPGGDFD